MTNKTLPHKIGPYLIDQCLGQGGQGTVYRGFDPVLQRHVAIKIFSLQNQSPESLVNEARIIARLAHPHIVQIYHTDRIKTKDKVMWYVAMEFLSKGSYEDYYKKNEKEMTPLDAIRFGLQVTSALKCAHAHQVIHQDIKPGNILVGQDGCLKVSVFGLARFSSGQKDKNSQDGTPHYMSPEQWLGQAIEPATDIYALGGCIYYLLTKRPLFTAKNLEELKKFHLTKKPIHPKQWNPNIPEILSQLILKCVRKKPQDRFRSAEELSSALQILENKYTEASTFSSDVNAVFKEEEQFQYLNWFQLQRPLCSPSDPIISIPKHIKKQAITTLNAINMRIPIVALFGPSDGGKELIVPYLYHMKALNTKLHFAHRVTLSPSEYSWIQALQMALSPQIAHAKESNQRKEIIRFLSTLQLHIHFPSFLHLRIHRKIGSSDEKKLAELCLNIWNRTGIHLLLEIESVSNNEFKNIFSEKHKLDDLYLIECEAMSRIELKNYLQDEWHHANGANRPWISTDAQLLLLYYSKGSLKKLKIILHNSLVIATMSAKHIINTWIIETAKTYPQVLISTKDIDSTKYQEPPFWPIDKVKQLLKQLRERYFHE